MALWLGVDCADIAYLLLAWFSVLVGTACV